MHLQKLKQIIELANFFFLKCISEECFLFNLNDNSILKLLWALRGLSEGTQALGHSDSTQITHGHLGNENTPTLEYLKHSNTWHLRHLDTFGRIFQNISLFWNLIWKSYVLSFFLLLKSSLLISRSISLMLFDSYLASSVKRSSKNKSLIEFWSVSRICFSTLFLLPFLCLFKDFSKGK